MTTSRLVSSSSSSSRALTLYRSLIRAARSLPVQQDRESLEEETKRRFRAAAREEKGKGGDGGKGGESEEKLSALLDEGEARLHDARHHGIPHARLEHAAQIPRAVLESAKKLLKSDESDEIGLPKDKGARAKLEAAVERRRLKMQKQQQQQEEEGKGQ